MAGLVTALLCILPLFMLVIRSQVLGVTWQPRPGRPRVNLWPAGSGQSEVQVSSFIFSLPLCGQFADVIAEEDSLLKKA